jgi:hypothetical protein
LTRPYFRRPCCSTSATQGDASLGKDAMNKTIGPSCRGRERADTFARIVTLTESSRQFRAINACDSRSFLQALGHNPSLGMLWLRSHTLILRVSGHQPSSVEKVGAVQQSCTATSHDGRQPARPPAHRASWDDEQTSRGAASSGRKGQVLTPGRAARIHPAAAR